MAPPRITARAALGPRAALALETPLEVGGCGRDCSWRHPSPQVSGSHLWSYLTPSAAEARSRRPRTHMVMATFTSCTSSSRRRELKKPSTANLAAE